MSWWQRFQFTLFLMAGGQQMINEYRLQVRNQLEDIWAAHLGTEMLGLSLLAVPDGLRLLPYVVPIILTWKRGPATIIERMAREGGGLRCC